MKSLAALVFLAVVVIRIRMLRSGLASASLWIAMAMLALALAMGTSPVYDQFGTSTDGRLASELTKLSLVVAAAAGVQVHNHVVAARSSRRIIAGSATGLAVILTTIVPLSLWPPRGLSPLLAEADSTTFFDSTWRSCVVWFPVLAYFTWIVTDGAIFCWRQSRQARQGPTRTALRLATAGFSIAGTYVVTKLYVITIWMIGRPTLRLMRVDTIVEDLAVLAVVVLLALASSWVAISARWRRLSWSMWSRRQARRLRPLWSALLANHPDLTLPVERRHRLRRMVVEIRDGLLALSEVTEKAAFEAARSRAMSVAAQDPDATAIAIVLATNHATDPPAAEPAVLPIGTSGELRAEVAWLGHVAHEYQRITHRRSRHLPMLTRARSGHDKPEGSTVGVS